MTPRASAGRFPFSQDLEAAFRASRRAAAFLAIEKKGKAAFAKVCSVPACWQSMRAYSRPEPVAMAHVAGAVPFREGSVQEAPDLWLLAAVRWLREAPGATIPFRAPAGAQGTKLECLLPAGSAGVGRLLETPSGSTRTRPLWLDPRKTNICRSPIK